MASHTPIRDRASAANSLHRIARIAVLSILLGLLVQSAILALVLWGGGERGAALASAAGGVAWAVLVCLGVGAATVLARGRALLSGVVSVAVAPASLAMAKGAQKMIGGWLGAAQVEPVLSLGTVSLLRGIEYGLLGWLLGRIVASGQERALPYVRAGALVGGLFGGAITLLTWWAAMSSGAPLSPVGLAATVVNEMVLPLGCALVILVGLEVGRSLKVIESDPAPSRSTPSHPGA